MVDRESNDDFWSFRMIESQKRSCINLGSYNYLGFAESDGPCTEQAIQEVEANGLAMCSPRNELGYMPIHKQVVQVFPGLNLCL